MVPYSDGAGRFPTYGYETSVKGAPLVLQVDTSKGALPGSALGVVLTYTKAQSGYGNAKVT